MRDSMPPSRGEHDFDPAAQTGAYRASAQSSGSASYGRRAGDTKTLLKLSEAERIAADRLARFDATGSDILELPEPLDSGTSAPAFDHAAWSADLERLLERTRPSPLQSLELALRQDIVLTDTPLPLPRVVAQSTPALARPKRRRSWMPAAMLCVCALAMAGIVGGAAFGLATPQAKALMSAASAMFEQWQIGSAR